MMKKQHLKSNMDIIIRKPLGYSYIGLKDRQEDAVWPLFEEATEKKAPVLYCAMALEVACMAKLPVRYHVRLLDAI
mgnify:CR=1 FL=1